MFQESASEPDPDDSDTEPEFVEVDPTARYGRYKEVLGKGAFKKVYRAFDECEGIEVAWNQVKVADLLRNSVDLERLYSEVNLLKTLKHKNIIKFYHSWADTKNENINFITEIFTSGTLRQYRKKHKHVDVRALKKWSRQILEGLLYLHRHDPPVIHRDLKCDNVFVNGNQGEVKIGDLGLAAILQQAHAAHSVIGTPEFMAPELYEEEYNELVDIYAFGMCLLELVTLEYPYVECANAAQIYKKVTGGIKPASLAKVKDPGVRAFIEKCISIVSDRLSAKELLMDPFLLPDEDSGSINCSLLASSSNVSSKADNKENWFGTGKTPEDIVLEKNRDFMVQGQRQDHNTIFLKLRIADSSGHVRNIHFPFDIEVDTSIDVASEMVEELDLTDHDVSVIATIIDSEIQSHIPDWEPRELSTNNFSDIEVAESGGYEAQDDAFHTDTDSYKSGSIILDRLPAGQNCLSSSYIVNGENSPRGPGPSKVSLVESATSGDSCPEENLQSPDNQKDVDYDFGHDDCRKPEFDSVPYDSKLTDIHRDMDALGNWSLASEGRTVPNKKDSAEIQSIVKKLEHVLNEQLKELDELKIKHDTAITNLVNELPEEIRLRVLSICNQKRSEYKIDDQEFHSANSLNSSS